ncbi:MAG TPA: hypothetical protein VKX49_12930 [Bryobacteraceae bacterium]|nr:hypothetical protein [Bryobacteraceae bacterium]
MSELNLASFRDAFGNSGEALVDLAVCGIVNAAPATFLYDPDRFAPLIVREAQKRLPRYPKPRAATHDELLAAASSDVQAFREMRSEIAEHNLALAIERLEQLSRRSVQRPRAQQESALAIGARA